MFISINTRNTFGRVDIDSYQHLESLAFLPMNGAIYGDNNKI